jgi:hypothetical protein
MGKVISNITLYYIYHQWDPREGSIEPSSKLIFLSMGSRKKGHPTLPIDFFFSWET